MNKDSVSNKENKGDDSMQQIVKMMQTQQDSMKELTDVVTNVVEDVRKLKGDKITKPKNFEESAERDDNVPVGVSTAVRAILGNDVKLVGIGSDDRPGFDLEITIPDSLHTPRQIEQSNIVREDLEMKEGKVIGRKMVTYRTKDKRTIFVPNHAAVAESVKWANRIADKIRHDFEVSKLPEPDFFK